MWIHKYIYNILFFPVFVCKAVFVTFFFLFYGMCHKSDIFLSLLSLKLLAETLFSIACDDVHPLKVASHSSPDLLPCLSTIFLKTQEEHLSLTLHFICKKIIPFTLYKVTLTSQKCKYNMPLKAQRKIKLITEISQQIKGYKNTDKQCNKLWYYIMQSNLLLSLKSSSNSWSAYLSLSCKSHFSMAFGIGPPDKM